MTNGHTRGSVNDADASSPRSGACDRGATGPRSLPQPCSSRGCSPSPPGPCAGLPSQAAGEAGARGCWGTAQARGPMDKGSEPGCCGAWSLDTAARGWGTQVTRALGEATGLRDLGTGWPGWGSCPASLWSRASRSTSLSTPPPQHTHTTISSSANPGNTGLASQSGGPLVPSPSAGRRGQTVRGCCPYLGPPLPRGRKAAEATPTMCTNSFGQEAGSHFPSPGEPWGALRHGTPHGAP